VEAISNGVSVFKRPEAVNAGKTMLWMADILVSMFLDIAFLVNQWQNRFRVITCASSLCQLGHGDAP